jgi:hypothetical protein
MKTIGIKLVLAAFMLSGGLNAQTMTGREIIQQVKDRPDGDSRYSEMTIKLENKKGKTRERKVKSYAMDVGEGMEDTKTLMFFVYPGDVKGTGFLTWDYDAIGKDDDRWLYLPAMKKTRRISGSSAKKDYFMGTDFTYDDLGSRNVDEDEHTFLREEIVGGFECWVVESVSKDNRDIYSRKISWIRKECKVAVRVEYYDRMDKLHRVLNLSEIVQVDGFWIAKKLQMENVQTNHKTYLTIENPKYNIDISESDFTVGNLEKGSV